MDSRLQTCFSKRLVRESRERTGESHQMPAWSARSHIIVKRAFCTAMCYLSRKVQQDPEIGAMYLFWSLIISCCAVQAKVLSNVCERCSYVSFAACHLHNGIVHSLSVYLSKFMVKSNTHHPVWRWISYLVPVAISERLGKETAEHTINHAVTSLEPSLPVIPDSHSINLCTRIWLFIAHPLEVIVDDIP